MKNNETFKYLPKLFFDNIFIFDFSCYIKVKQTYWYMFIKNRNNVEKCTLTTGLYVVRDFIALYFNLPLTFTIFTFIQIIT